MDDEKRQLILDATRQLIQKHGLHGTSMSMIVKASGVPMGTIYRYFKDKDSLINELHREIVKHAASYVCKGLDDSQSLREQLELLIHNLIELNQDQPDRFLTKSILDTVPRPEEERQALIDEFFHPVQRFAQRGIDAGIFKPLSPELILMLGLGPIEWYFRIFPNQFNNVTAEQQALFIEACWEAICVNPTKDIEI